jgi:hypothetical protein
VRKLNAVYCESKGTQSGMLFCVGVLPHPLSPFSMSIYIFQQMMCWHVSRNGHVFACAGAFQGLFVFVHGVCMCERPSVYLHASRAGHVSECVDMYQELVVYWHVLAHIKS